ncbi:hypothetical protein HAX54_045291 [Datura stramonium]|uniref:WRKY domain-containing protein n=1 Tax=Datura stramonium TaxID=4076 RepID=A0ABS8RPR3_DATST|nr:hypothetical protein [Datura stramonium]
MSSCYNVNTSLLVNHSAHEDPTSANHTKQTKVVVLVILVTRSPRKTNTILGKAFCYRGKSTERYEILAEKLSEADQWRWRKYGMKRTSGSPFLKNYYRCNEVEDLSGQGDMFKSSTDANK